MVCIQAKDYWFRYPGQKECAVEIGEWSLERGAFCLLTGESGSGKTTLLHQLSKNVMLQGESGGSLMVDSHHTGYVWQEPGSQIVTDRVEYEMVFGMENLGVSKERMQRRLAEMVTFFGMESLLGRDTMKLSGGEMQTLNVASALAVNPDLLLLDEPTSQLDPVGARSLTEFLRRIHEELGTTIVVAEQRLEELVPLADVMVLMERGKIQASGSVQEVFWKQRETGYVCFPSYMRLFGELEQTGNVPETPGDARRWFEENFRAGTDGRSEPENKTGERYDKEERNIISCRNISFRYQKSMPDVLRECCCEIPMGMITCLAGGNGSGKTTLLEILSRRYAPYRGKIKNLPASCSLLPQTVEYLFLYDTLEEEWNAADRKALVYGERFGLRGNSFCETIHPADLSGGERQRLGLALALGREAELYLLDEPTKGLDDKAKQVLGEILREKKEEGKTVLFVSHDMEFGAACADYMALLFQGQIPLFTDRYSFFTDNQFYTTGISRIARNVSEHIITREDVSKYAEKKDC